MKRIAVVDNYDSFTYNLVQLLAELGAEPVVFRNDEVSLDELEQFDALVVSPGPGTPNDAGVSTSALQRLSGQMPILGVCLGHQCLASALGAEVVRGEPVHGKIAQINHDGSRLFEGVPQPFDATRYHSLVVEESTLPETLRVTARSDDGVVMALEHREHPTFGVQFHPESVMTPEGRRILGNFLRVS